MPDEAITSTPTAEAETISEFVCDCDKYFRSACAGQPFYKEHEGKGYCVLHYPDKEKTVAFKEALKRKLDAKDFDFRGVWFPDEVSFYGFEFDTEADFVSASFNAAADFRSATFRAEAYFSYATFSAEMDFSYATFSTAAYFSSASFNAAAAFRNASFNAEAAFRSATFSALADFNSTRFSALADFISASFNAEADFNSASFSAEADFSSAAFSAEAYFSYASFSTAAYFSSATFSAEAYFNPASFSAEADFRSASFSTTADFRSATFSAAAYFISASFSAEAYFSYAKFSAEADFRSTSFSTTADFRSACFSAAAYFISASFNAAADFNSASFNAAAYFRNASFSAAADFSYVTFKSYVKFSGSNDWPMFGELSSLDLQFATFDNPSQVSFHTLTLRPRWFINVDPTEFDFTAVDWKHDSLKREIEYLNKKESKSPYKLLAKTCQILAKHTEEDRLYEDAARFRYMAMEALRKNKWHGRKVWKTDWLHILYWVVSGYGERVLRALGVLIGIALLFALLYTQVGFNQQVPKLIDDTGAQVAAAYEVVAPLRFPYSCFYSLRVMILQKPEPQPATIAANIFVILETILGPLQAVLLALAIRRKFMR